ncbi:MAG TPA: PQQ-dependent sugar dehydrogenase [Gemmatimonadales bacterium]|nr:PQQ-dependent sugar dehydrogenase [Gemmatimonadales bacterium]
MPRRTIPLALLLIACASPAQNPVLQSPTPGSTPGIVGAETVAEGLEHPWGLAFMPDGRMLVTERPGRLRIVSMDGTISAPLSGVPTVLARGQGGLLVVAVDPDFASNQMVYVTFSEPGEVENTASTAVGRGRLTAAGIEGFTVLYRQVPKVQSFAHYGSRIVFAGDGTMWVTAGDRQNQRPLVQDLATGVGKIVRINRDGSIPADNPFRGQSGVVEQIWSYGHRNLQGATAHPETGRLWTVEHGARGGDELNHPEAGKNYGWPVITYGIDYNGTRIGEGTHKEGMEQPVYYWDPVIAPSGMTFYTGNRYPGWNGSLLIGSLTPGALVRLELNGDRVVKEERYLGELGARIRDVVQGPDGYLYLLTDASNGKLLRVVPK